MRRSSRRIPLLLLPPLLLAVAWLVFDGWGGADEGDRPEVAVLNPTTDRNPQRNEPAPIEAGPTELVDPAQRTTTSVRTSDTTVRYPLEIDLTLVAAGAVPEAEDTLPRGSGADARIRGRIMGANGRPSEALIEFVHGPNAGRKLRCNADGAFGANDLYAGLAVVDVTTPQGRKARRDVLLRRLGQQQLNIHFGGPATVAGTVLDRAGEPIAGAEVTVDGNLAYTDDQGVFRLAKVASGLHIVVTIRATGYALHRASVSLERQGVVTADKFRFQLEPEATLQVSVPNALGVFQDVQVHLMPSGGREQRDFPWELVSPVLVKPGTQTTVTGLRRGTFQAIAYHSGAVAVPKQQTVRVETTRKNLLEVELGPTPTMKGTVRRGDEVVSGAIVRLEAPDLASATTKSLRRSPRYAEQILLPHVAEAVQETRTDGSGRFTLTAYGEPREVRYLSVESADGTWVGNAIVRVGDPEVTVELRELEDRVGSIRLKIDERWQGLPVEIRRDGEPLDPFVLAPDDDLVIEELTEGMWRLHANWRGTRVVENQQVPVVDGETVDVAAGLPPAAIEGDG